MKEHDLNSIRKLARSSLRLNLALLGAVSLALMLIGACYWALGRVVQEEREKVHAHFSRLVGDIREHEAFLKRIALQTGETARQHDLSVIPLQKRLLARQRGMQIHEGREFSFAMPFTLAQPDGTAVDTAGNFFLGVMLANLYSSFWSGSAFPSPQLLVLDLHGGSSIAVPAIDGLRDQSTLTLQSYLPLVERVATTLQAHTPRYTAAPVNWARAQPSPVGGARVLYGYVSLDVPDELWGSADPPRRVTAVTVMDLDGINSLERSLQRPAFEELELVSPGGQVLIDTLGKAADYAPGLNIDRNGLVFKVPSSLGGGWTAFYRLDYGSFFQYAKWQFLGGLLVVVCSLVGGWAATRWYKRRVVGPARQARVDILESHAFSRAVIHTAPMALCVLRRADHDVVLKNRLAQAWLGDEQAITQLSQDWDFGGSAESVGKEFVLQHGQRYLHVTFALTRFRGEEVVLCSFNDITDHRRAQQILTEAKHSADAASEAKTLFLATMSHEIRTPLYGVLGTLELLGLTELNRQQRDYLDTIERSSATLMQLISDILDVSKIEAGQLALEATDFDPLALAQEVVAGFAALAAGKHLQLQACLDPALPGKVHGDANRIRQILNNLLSNALKFTEHGQVVLRLKVPDASDGQVRLQWQVSDTGIGMSPEQQRRIFEPFYQAHGHKPSVTGTGLGLSICLRLSEMMGGDLRVVSEAGRGSSFTFEVRLAMVAARPALALEADLQGSVVVPSHTRAVPLGKLGLRVLVAEDNPINQVLLKEQLEELGCQVTLADNGRTALECWQLGSYDALLTDINMPVMNGFELVRALREQGAGLPIIGVTANALREEGERCMAVGMNAWLAKPLSLRTLHDGLLGVVGDRAGPAEGERQQGDDLQVPGKMRELFITTMRQDMRALQHALADADLAVARQHAHRLRGALAVVHADALSDACAVMEEVLGAETDGQELARVVDQALQRIDAALAKL